MCVCVCNPPQMEKFPWTTVKKLQFLKTTITVVIGLSLLLTLLVQMGKILQRYSEGPTYISTTIDHQKNADFPAITICPNSIQYNLTRLKEHGFKSSKDYNDARKGRVISWKSNGTLSSWDLFEYITISSADLIEIITVKVADETIISLNGSDPSSLTAQGHRKFGRCWTFYPKAEIRNRGIHSVRLIFKIDVKIYVHQKGQFLDFSGRMGYKVYLGEHHQTQINYQDLKMLEKNEEKGKFFCKKMVYDECMYGAVRDIMLNETGCVAPWVMDKSKRICEESTRVNTSFWIAWNRITNQQKDCPNPCDFLLAQMGDKNYISLNDSTRCISTYYFASKVTFSEELYLYTGLTLFAEVGGYLGLLLGLSFFDVSEVLRKLFDKRVQAALKEENKTFVSEKKADPREEQ